MALQKYAPSGDAPSMNRKLLSFIRKANEKDQLADPERRHVEADMDIDLREVYFLIMHFLSAGPCHRTYGQFWNELLEHQLLPRRYHAWYSRSGAHSGDENDDGLSFPLSYNKLVERYPHIEKDHLVKLLKQLLLSTAAPSRARVGGNALNAASVPTLLGTGPFSLLGYARNKSRTEVKPPSAYMRWPHRQADQVRALSLREIGGGFTRHHRAPSVRAACYAIAKPSTMVQKMENIKKVRGHRNAVYCAIFDRSGRYVVTGSDDRLVKIWSMETAYCLASCRGHDGDITDLAVSSNNTLVASASNDCIIRVWRLPDGQPISVLRGHTGAVTAIAFSPRPGSVYQLLSSSDDGTCRIWDARNSEFSPRVYVPRPPDFAAGKNNGQSSSLGHQSHQIFCCAFNANGTVFVTGSSDTLARVWNACKPNADDSEQPNHEMDVLAGHENDVNYVQFSGCAVASRFFVADASKEENLPKFKNTWFTHDNIVTCSRDGSAIIWIPRSRRSHSKVGRWTRAYHLKVPPPPVPPQPPRGGPRQRILPTPRGVNMIIWSLDNRFVLAAIMDCRICVWNAVDGSLVHSLTGHNESTYVLDVHPFNPRIAMSAGYDGKTIVWDIWEGTPIRIYEIGRFKLVDGKFSPDGTSIILSDDVGQLYILNTGQGESQKDAKYDQFFLGDYRPLIHDDNGNVLDQETQLAPHRRNLQDLLCDSSMIPYPEPYQSMYQQRRLGALGIEWRPSSVRFAVGDQGSMDQDFQTFLETDLDILIDPLPEFVDAMEWEPEIELQSEDTDSEYNITEEYSSGREQGGLSYNSSGDSECSEDDSEVEHTREDGLRRSKRKKQKAEVEIMTSSGRRVKRRNLDECDGGSPKNYEVRKRRNGRKASRRKSSSSKLLRPQRAAARNALTLFSRITGTSTDGEDDDSLECDLSENESALQHLDSEESDGPMQNELHEHSKGKEVLFDDFEDVDKHRECSESHVDAGNRRRLVLKLPVCDVDKLVIPENTSTICENRPDLISSSSKAPHEAGEHPTDLFEGYSDGKIRWGGVRARTSKRLKMGETLPSYGDSSSCLNGGVKIENNVNGHPIIEREGGKICPSIATQNSDSQIDKMLPLDPDGARNCKAQFDELKEYGESSIQALNTDDTTTSSVPHNNGSQNLFELIEHPTPIPTKLRSERNSRDDESHSELKTKSSPEDARNGGCNMLSISPSDPEPYINSEVPDHDSINRSNSHRGEQNGVLKSEVEINRTFGPVLQDAQKSRSHDKMYNAVYRRSKLSRARNNQEGESGPTDASTSSVSNHNIDIGVDHPGTTTEGIRRTRSMGLCAHPRDANVINSNIIWKELDGSEDISTSVEKSSINRSNGTPCEEWGPGSRVTVGLRSTRSRRGSYHIRDTSPPERKKPHQTAGNSWLMLWTHDVGSRYIPQLGDEVVYLRQGHQEYIGNCGSRDLGPWRTIKGNIRAVEFCRVEGLDYSTRPGSGESCCKMTLQFVDPSSTVAGKSFTLTLPEVNNFPDFLVEKTRYDAAIHRNWTSRDKCQVWWNNEGEEDGSWWEGRILSVKPKSPEFPESPWERYLVQYKSDPRETHLHGPWELYDADTQWEQPRIDDEVRDKLLRSFAKLEQSGNRVQDHYGVQKLKQVSHRSNFVNRFPVALSVDLIQARLDNNYYRSLEAMKHDITLMLSNAESYFGRNAELSVKIKRLSEWFTRTLSSL